MSFAYMPLYTGDYVRDTQHLSCSEHGIYLKLLMHCWDQKGPVPLDERKLCGIVNARSGDEIEALRRVLGEYFVRMADGWYNPRMMRQVQAVEALSNNRAVAGRLGGLARAAKASKQVLSKCQASAKQEPVTPTPTSNIKTKPKNTCSSGDELFPKFWSIYPRRVGKEQARKAWAKLKADDDLLARILKAVEEQKRSEGWKDVQYIPHPATWLNGHRWEDELVTTSSNAEPMYKDWL